MKKNAVIPYILIMVFGIVLVVGLSIKGLYDVKDGAKGKEKTSETAAASKPEDIYKQSCIACHGDQYQGTVGPALKGVGKKYSKEELIDIVTKGKGNMPPTQVSAEQAPVVADWLATLK
ncbi:MAG TPA: cytochrome c [Bacillales bacterium]|nr:cytochrome c [Bacillales bacterium]